MSRRFGIKSLGQLVLQRAALASCGMEGGVRGQGSGDWECVMFDSSVQEPWPACPAACGTRRLHTSSVTWGGRVRDRVKLGEGAAICQPRIWEREYAEDWTTLVESAASCL